MSCYAVILQGDARALPLPDASVDLIITSPPYFALRSYKDGGVVLAGQVGAEATATGYVDALMDCTAEWLRVLKPAGSLWVNLGDKYTGSAKPGGQSSSTLVGTTGHSRGLGYARAPGRPKSLLGLPWRYALRCIDDCGLILRSELIWSKPNGLPESVTDRVRRSHETWFHFVKQPRYFAAVDELREPVSARPGALTYGERKARGMSGRDPVVVGARHSDVVGHNNSKVPHPLGKLPGSVWSIPTQPLIVPAALGIDHFAAFPMEWPKRLILGWSPSGVCTACGEGRRPVTDAKRARTTPRRLEGASSGASGQAAQGGYRGDVSREITGETCACPEPTAPTTQALVLDPFGGTGTTALMASVLGRVGISVDMSADYCRLAVWRTTDEKQLAKAREKCGLPGDVSQ